MLSLTFIRYLFVLVRRIDRYTTSLFKVYAVGYRYHEVNLTWPVCPAIDQFGVKVYVPADERERSVNYRRLPFGAVRNMAPLSADRHHPVTMYGGLRKRLLKEIKSVSKSKLREMNDFVLLRLKEKYPVLDRIYTTQEYLDSTDFNQERKNQYLAAEELYGFGKPDLESCRMVQSFIKLECYKSYKWPRFINSRIDAFKLFSACRFKAIEDVLYKEMDYFVKHLTNEQKCEKIKSLIGKGKYYYITDFTAFESHMVPDIMRVFECNLYQHMLNHSFDVDFICKVLTGVNKLRTRTGFKAEVLGRRMSGEACTSLGNSFTNLMLMDFITSKKNGKFYGYVEGDDGIFATTVPVTKEDYASLGFDVKIWQIEDPCTNIPVTGLADPDVAFCGLVFTQTGEVLRDPIKFLMKFGWTHSFVNAGTKIMMGLLKAKCLSACFETPQCPIVGAVARYCFAKCAKYEAVWVNDHYHEEVPKDFKIPDFQPSHEARLLFERIYGISVEQQVWLEKYVQDNGPTELAQYLDVPDDIIDYASRYVEIR